MAIPLPTVLEGVDLIGFIQHVFDKHSGPSTIVVCSAKDAFTKQLHAAFAEDKTRQEPVGEGQNRSRIVDWQTPTLRLLAASRTIRVAFCPELPHLRAYLSTYAYLQAESETHPTAVHVGEEKRILAVLNLIDIHRLTSAFSAQGINRTLAVAVEAAHRSQSQLMLAERPWNQSSVRPEYSLADDQMMPVPDHSESDPWDEEVSILNVTTKSFGAGERGWVGRTIKLRRIAARWCRFENVRTGT